MFFALFANGKNHFACQSLVFVLKLSLTIVFLPTNFTCFVKCDTKIAFFIKKTAKNCIFGIILI